MLLLEILSNDSKVDPKPNRQSWIFDKVVRGT